MYSSLIYACMCEHLFVINIKMQYRNEPGYLSRFFMVAMNIIHTEILRRFRLSEGLLPFGSESLVFPLI